MTTASSDQVDQFVRDFLVESNENLDQLDQDFVRLEQDPDSLDLLSAIFRTFHNIKGGSSFFEFPRLTSLTHAGETLLDHLRDGRLRTSPEIVDALLVMVDVVRQLLDGIDATGSESGVDVDTTVSERALLGYLPDAAGPAPTETAAPVSTPAPAPSDPVEPTPVAVTVPQPRTRATRRPKATPAPKAPVVDVAPEPPATETAETPETPEPATVAVTAPKAPAAPAAPGTEPARRTVGDNGVRVDVALLDQLVRSVGELVLTRNQLVREASGGGNAELTHIATRLDMVATELQEGVMKTRMQPVDQVGNKLPRLVRDLGATCGKQVRMVMEGGETELDRTLLEAIKDPLMHIVRNAVDHGVELPEDRVRLGKPAEGTISLRAFHEGGRVVVEASDDGRGIDPAVLGPKAVARGLLDADELARLSPTEVANLVFRPGFSTAAEITNVSGRGVGMDVVRSNIEKIGGTVQLTSVPGAGTTVRMSIPLTLAVIPALVIGELGGRYCIPQSNVLEVVRLAGDEVTDGIENVAGAPVYRLRGRLLPLVLLNEQLGLSPTPDIEELYIVVLSSDQTTFGLVVELIHGMQEIVVKPLSPELTSIKLFAGATIMGDGDVSIILDVPSLAVRAHMDEDRSGSAATFDDKKSGVTPDHEKVLVCELPGSRRFAVPLMDVAWVEEFLPSTAEFAGDVEVFRGRDQLLPLLRLDELLGTHGVPVPTHTTDPEERPEPMWVVVHDRGGRTVGLLVKQVVGVVSESFTLEEVGMRQGLSGSAVISDRVTDLLDIPGLVAASGAGHHG